jgi:DNA-binding CsgD family transcriptional regulator
LEENAVKLHRLKNSLRTDSFDQVPADNGILMIDFSLNVVAADRGATAILYDHNRPLSEQGRVSWLSLTSLEAIRDRQSNDIYPSRVGFRVGKHLYSCCTYLLEPKNGVVSRTLLALHLTRESHVQDALHQVAIDYHLTDREQEALVGISMGLTSKELADQMNISPNTVKAFTRLIMLKMGVSTRTGILGKVLEMNRHQDDTESS